MSTNLQSVKQRKAASGTKKSKKKSKRDNAFDVEPPSFGALRVLLPESDQFDLKSFDELQQRDKDTASGYVRRTRSLLDNRVIPNMVVRAIAIYFATRYEWDAKCMGASFVMDKRNPRILRKTKDVHQSVFVSNVVSSGCYCWKFRVLAYKKHSFSFGVVLASAVKKYAKYDDYGLLGNISRTTYCWDTGMEHEHNLLPFEFNQNRHSTDDHSSYGPPTHLKPGDVVSVQLDLIKLTLSFAVNATSYGVAHEIQKVARYRCAMHVYDKDTVVELL